LSTDLQPGARNAIRVCLNVQPDEHVTVVTDQACQHIADALVREIDDTGAASTVFVLESLAPRPLTGLPAPIAEDLERSTVSIFAAQAQTNELGSRIALTDIVNRRRIRHAHMVNITDEIMCQGMRADFHLVDKLSQRVIDIVRPARTIRASTPAGTDLHATLDPNLRWIKTSGLISTEKWGNLPGGEIFTTPGEVNGTFVIDGVVGDWLCDRYGNLKHSPLTIEIEKSRLVDARSANARLRDDFWKYTHTDENSDRVGEFAIGTNIELKGVIGHILQDEKLPGIHIAFGNPYGAHTGAQWFSSTHIDVVGTEFDIWVDDRAIMHRGAFTI
jgi:aminopeptidase